VWETSVHNWIHHSPGRGKRAYIALDSPQTRYLTLALFWGTQRLMCFLALFLFLSRNSVVSIPIKSSLYIFGNFLNFHQKIYQYNMMLYIDESHA
jgi:hypothetical protein